LSPITHLSGKRISHELLLEPVDNKRLAALCGPFNEHLNQIEQFFNVEVHHRGHVFQVVGQKQSAKTAGRAIAQLYQEAKDCPLTSAKVSLTLNQTRNHTMHSGENQAQPPDIVRINSAMIKARTANQSKFLLNIIANEINFAIGPAGTGKTYLAVAAAVRALEQDSVKRVVLVRPAVEAGERLGFLPGDLVQKVDPYLRPLYDALYEMLGFDRVSRYVERNIIEIAPLAFMRGRSLNEAFIILDEAQNTTVEQMKMFLTRVGFGSKVIIAGDTTQVDLHKKTISGLKHAAKILSNVKGISFTYFQSNDVVRHPLVQRIVEAYETEQENHGDREKK
jgi:phosphate starvation-inducible PhoH-like protein